MKKIIVSILILIITLLFIIIVKCLLEEPTDESKQEQTEKSRQEPIEKPKLEQTEEPRQESIEEPKLKPTEESRQESIQEEPVVKKIPKINVKQGIIYMENEIGNYNFKSIIADGNEGVASDYTLFKIQNTGEGILLITNITLNTGDISDFDLISNIQETLAPSETTSFKVRFDPGTIGKKKASIIIKNNDPDKSVFTFTLTGITPAAQIKEIISSVIYNLRYIPAGKYNIGDIPDNTNEITLTNGYWIAETEITYELWREIYIWAINNGYYFGNLGTKGDGNGDTQQHPVTKVNWFDCVVWCNAISEKKGLSPVYIHNNNVIRDSRNTNSITYNNTVFNYETNGYRLPTEAEWEIAARGANIALKYNTYNTIYAGSDIIDIVAWYSDNSDGSTHEVGRKIANELGIFDMSGNVWEWCWNWYDQVVVPDINPVGPQIGSFRIARGFCWSCSANAFTITFRNYFAPYSVNNSTGFRIVKNE